MTEHVPPYLKACAECGGRDDMHHVTPPCHTYFPSVNLRTAVDRLTVLLQSHIHKSGSLADAFADFKTAWFQEIHGIVDKT